MNIFLFWNESSEFPLFLKGKFDLIYECFGLQARFRNELCSQTKVPPRTILDMSSPEIKFKPSIY
jgi:hypothetical protein